MATPKDPNKTLLEEQALIDQASPTYGLSKSQFATAYHGQVVDGFVITVENGEITGIAAEEP
jgi:leucyl aminopeptidase (aminopeptidase T)